MMMLLLVSAVVLLVGPAAANTTRHNLNHIIDLADKYNKSLTEVRAHLLSTTVFCLVNFLFCFIFMILLKPFMLEKSCLK